MLSNITMLVSRPSIRPVHGGNLPRHGGPFEFTTNWLLALLLLLLIELHKLVDEAQVRLDDDVQAASTDETAVGSGRLEHYPLHRLGGENILGTWEAEALACHDFSDTDGCRARNAHAAMDQSCCAISLASSCKSR